MSVPYLVGSAPRIKAMASVRSRAMMVRTWIVRNAPSASASGTSVGLDTTVPPWYSIVSVNPRSAST